MMIQYACSKDLNKISKCHIAAFPKSISSELGEKVVASMLQWYLSSPNKFLFYIEEEGIVIGYCGGVLNDGSDSYGSSSGMTQFGFKDAALSFMRKPWLLFHPEVRSKYPFIITNILRKIGLRKDSPRKKIISNSEQKFITAGLVVIGVRPHFQGKGLGSLLLQEFERKAIEMGAERLALTVRKENESAIISYLRNGYLKSLEKENSLQMTKNLI